jgi:hypothetical protein
MSPILPFWFKQRQCKAESAGDDTLRVSGPNLGEAFLSVRADGDGRRRSALRLTADGPEVAATEPEAMTDQVAWEAAFELYRNHVIT